MKKLLLTLLVLISVLNLDVFSQGTQTFTTSGSWICPAGVTSLTVQCWGGGGGGGGSNTNAAARAGGGGGGGGFSQSTVAVTSGTSYPIVVGTGGPGGGSAANGTNGNPSTFNTTIVVANGGSRGSRGSAGAGGNGATIGTGTITFTGGNGAAGVNATASGGGGGAAGTTGNGGNAVGITAGTGTALNGGAGGGGRNTTNPGNPGLTYGGGGSGGYQAAGGAAQAGGAGADGLVILSWTIPNQTCASAVTLTSSTSCVLSYGYSSNATGSGSACGIGNADDVLWYKFVATATTHTVTVDGAANYDAVLGAYNSCGGAQPTGGACVNATGADGIETLNLSGLTIGNTYFIEVYDNAAGGGDFTICVTNPTPPPANDDCSSATSLTSNFTCTTTAGNSAGATLSGVAGCSTGNPDDDMWYSFVAVATTHTVTVNGAANYDAVLGAYVSCGGAQPAGGTCVNATGADGNETLTLTGLTIGNTYFIEVHDNAAGGGDFTICVTHPGDNCSFPISLTTSTSCVTTAGNSASATLSGVAGCTVGNEDDDMWYSFVATTTTATVTVDGAANYDAVVGAYNSCGGGQPTGGTCVDVTAGNGIETLNLSGLTIGNTYFIEVHDFGAGGGDYTICVVIPGPPSCATYNVPSTTCGNSTTLTWNAPGSGSAPTGYKLYFGTDNPPTNIVNGTNLGAVLAYAASGLSNSTTYYWQIVPTNASGDATGCSIQNFTSGAGGAPTNDDPCNATTLIPSATCSYATYTNECATGTTAGAPPAPGCAGYSGGDVWFRVTVPASGSLTFDTQAGVMTDGGMAVYSGVCGALTLISCDDNTGTGNMPQITVTGQTVGATLWVRIWENGNDGNGTFGICVTNPCPFGIPSNDDCAGALPLTLGSNLYGNINTCTGATGEPAAASCWTAGTLNTVWYSVVPTGTTLNIRCSPGSLMATQIALYSGTCGTLTQIFCNNNAGACSGTTYSISEINATGLTAGATYYIRVDGENNNIGTFSIVAVDGAGTYPGLDGQDCSTPTNVCALTMNIPDPGYQGVGNKCDHAAVSCLGNGERGSHWLQITITGNGNLFFTITPNDYDAATCSETDYDFVMWRTAGTGATTNCGTISTTPATGLVACNWSGLGVTGCSATGNTPAGFGACNYNGGFETGIAATSGDVYLLEVMNFTNSTSGYTIDFTSSTCTIQTTSSASLTWQGSVSDDFASAVNYGSCSAPDCSIDVTTNNSAPNQPSVNINSTVNNLTIGVGSFLTIEDGITLTICGNLVNNGTIFAFPNSTIQFTHASNSHNMTGNLSGTSALGNLVVNKAAGSVQLNNALDLQGNFTTSSGTSVFNSNGQYIKVGGNFTNNNGSTTFTNTTGGTLEFIGTAAQTYNQGSSNLDLNNVTVNNTNGDVSLSSVMRMSGALTMTSGILTTTGTNLLTLLPSATSTVGTSASTSYVNGPMRIQKNSSGSSTINFPIGKTPDCRPISLTVNHGNTTLYNYTSESFNSPANALGYTLPITIDTVSAIHYWNIARTDNGGTNQPSVDLVGNQTIQLFFGANDDVKDGNYLSVVKNTDAAPTAWIDIGGTGGPAPTGSQLVGSITSNSNPSAFNSFSIFTLGSQLVGNNPLPIELLSFQAIPNASLVNLKWSTASELNNNFFTIERSADGIVFEALEKINSKALNGTSNTTLNYSTKDLNPIDGYSYYRLKQTDFDGTSKYSKIVTVNFSKSKNITFAVYPNPNYGEFTVDFSGIENNHEVEITLVDIKGRVIYKNSVFSEEQTTSIKIIPLEKISAGIYFCNLVVEGVTYTAKVIVN